MGRCHLIPAFSTATTTIGIKMLYQKLNVTFIAQYVVPLWFPLADTMDYNHHTVTVSAALTENGWMLIFRATINFPLWIKRHFQMSWYCKVVTLKVEWIFQRALCIFSGCFDWMSHCMQKSDHKSGLHIFSLIILIRMGIKWALNCSFWARTFLEVFFIHAEDALPFLNVRAFSQTWFSLKLELNSNKCKPQEGKLSWKLHSVRKHSLTGRSCWTVYSFHP